jgi:putative ABC transport system permease protein
MEEILDRNALQDVKVRKADAVFKADDPLNGLTLIVAEKGSLDGYFALQDLDTGAALELPDSGALVPRRFWEYYHINVGENVMVYDSGMNLNELRISGVFENYYGQLFFLTPQGYEEVFLSAPERNCFFVKTNGMELETLQQKLADVKGLVKVNDASAERNVIGQFTASLNFVVWLMLFIAGMMACFIVANFSMTYVQRKTRELTIMRINGFTIGECIRYAAVDLVITTILGTVLGLVLGGVFGARILRVTETPYIQMIREPAVKSFLYSALITCGFSVLANGFALRRVRKLKLSDIA